MNEWIWKRYTYDVLIIRIFSIRPGALRFFSRLLNTSDFLLPSLALATRITVSMGKTEHLLDGGVAGMAGVGDDGHELLSVWVSSVSASLSVSSLTRMEHSRLSVTTMMAARPAQVSLKQRCPPCLDHLEKEMHQLGRIPIFFGMYDACFQEILLFLLISVGLNFKEVPVFKWTGQISQQKLV